MLYFNKKTIIIIILLLFIIILNADFNKRCKVKVKYKNSNSWTTYNSIMVYFFTGDELNILTGRYDFELYTVYAVIIKNPKDLIIIKITDRIVCGGLIIRSEDIELFYPELNGYDQNNNKWKIYIKDSYF